MTLVGWIVMTLMAVAATSATLFWAAAVVAGWSRAATSARTCSSQWRCRPRFSKSRSTWAQSVLWVPSQLSITIASR